MCVSFVSCVHAQELHTDFQGVMEGTVVSIDTTEKRTDVDGGEQDVQTMQVLLRDGPESGKTVQVVNDYIPVRQGDHIFVGHFIDVGGETTYSMHDVDRRPVLYAILALFMLIVVFFGGWQGFRSLLALGVSFLALIYVLIPLLLSGYSPILVGSIVASIILFFAIFLTYGFTAQAWIAFISTLLAVAFTGVAAWGATTTAHISGMGSEEMVYLQLSSHYSFDMVSLVIAGIIIGSLGVLDDIAVTQVSVVKELLRANASLSRKDLYARALSVGQSHVSALVNTLVLAYTGASLPLLLLFSQTVKDGGTFYGSIINMEIFAVEIVRMVIGSAGLVLAVPIATLMSVWYFSRNPKKAYDVDTHSEHGHHHH